MLGSHEHSGLYHRVGPEPLAGTGVAEGAECGRLDEIASELRPASPNRGTAHGSSLRGLSLSTSPGVNARRPLSGSLFKRAPLLPRGGGTRRDRTKMASAGVPAGCPSAVPASIKNRVQRARASRNRGDDTVSRTVCASAMKLSRAEHGGDSAGERCLPRRAAGRLSPSRYGEKV